MLKTFAPPRMSHYLPMITDRDRNRIRDLLENESCVKYASPGVRADLALKLETAQPADAKSIGRDVVMMNSTVMLEDVRWSNAKVVRLVYPNEEAEEGTISIFSPIGVKILGARLGQTVQMKLADSATCFRIAQILY